MASDVNGVLDVASKIVDATSNTETKSTSTNTAQVENNSTPIKQDTMTDSTSTVKTQGTATIETQQTVQTTPETQQAVQEKQQSTTSTPVTTGTTSKVSQAYLNELYTQNPTLYGYATKQGYSVYNWNNQLWVNNTAVDWKALGLKQDAKGNIVGTQAQLDQILLNVKSAGYTSSKAISPYITSMGYALQKVAGNVWTINGKLVDFSKYANLGMKIVNNAWVGPESAYKQILKDIDSRADETLDKYVAKLGYSYQRDTSKTYPGQYINGLYVSDATLKTYGLDIINNQIVGPKEKFDKLLNDVKGMGYTSNKSIDTYLAGSGLTGFKQVNGNIYTVGGKEVNFSQYGLKQVNGKWIGKEEQYQQILDDLKARSKQTMNDYLKSKGLNITVQNGQLFINNKGMTTSELNSLGIKGVNGKWWGSDAQYNDLIAKLKEQGYSTNLSLSQYFAKNKTALKHVSGNIWTVNGKPVDLSKYDDISIVNGGWSGSEKAYKQILNDVKTRANTDFVTYAKSQGMRYDVVNGQMAINNMPITTELLNQHGITVINGKWYGSQENFNAMIQHVKDQGYTTNKPLATYLSDNGMQAPKQVYGDVWSIGGKYVYLNDKDYTSLGMRFVEGVGWVGSETAYKKLMDVVKNQSSDTLDTYLQKKGFTFEVKDGKYYANGNQIDASIINGAGLKIMAGKIVGTDAQFAAALKKIEEPYTYKSAFEDEIQNALDQINEFKAYQTPQETLDTINALIKSAQETFKYNPAEDSALIQAQKEAERVVREGIGARGMLYSSGTIEQTARKAAELIPQFEQAAYQRFADEKNRSLNVANALMQWDNMLAQQHMDELEILTQKFNVLMDMDTRAFEQFQAVLSQRNTDREYALEKQRYELEAKTAAIQQAWDRVNATGKVSTKEDSVLLGVPIGTKAAWLQEIELNQKNALANAKLEYENAVKLQKSQKEIDSALIKYKAALDYSNSKKIQDQGYKQDIALQKQEYKNNLSLTTGASNGKIPTGSKLTVSSGYGGMRPANERTAAHQHAGIDIPGKYGQNVTSVFGGTVVKVVKGSSSAGNYVVVKNPNGTYERFLHMTTNVPVKVGQKIPAGGVVGYMGNSGTNAGGNSGKNNGKSVHLHYEIRKDSGAGYAGSLNPMDYIS